MYNANALNTYQQNSVNTASKERLMLMLFDGLVKFIRQGIAGIEEKDIKKTNANLTKAQSIVLEFIASLNMEVGGDIAKSLSLLYDYMHRRLVEANIKKDSAIANEVLGFAEELKETFEEAYRLTKK